MRIRRRQIGVQVRLEFIQQDLGLVRVEIGGRLEIVDLHDLGAGPTQDREGIRERGGLGSIGVDGVARPARLAPERAAT